MCLSSSTLSLFVALSRIRNKHTFLYTLSHLDMDYRSTLHMSHHVFIRFGDALLQQYVSEGFSHKIRSRNENPTGSQMLPGCCESSPQVSQCCIHVIAPCIQNGNGGLVQSDISHITNKMSCAWIQLL